jgi:hypothetical protein
MAEAEFSVRETPDLAFLAPASLALFGQENDIFSTTGWYRCISSHALPQGVRAMYLAIQHGTEVLAIFPMQRGPGRCVAALTTPYTCLWQPLLRAGLQDDPQTVTEIGRQFASACRGAAVVRLDAMDANAGFLAPFLAGFDHFGNWHVSTGGQDFAAYLAARPGALREAIRRRSKKLMGTTGARLTVIDGPEGLEPAIAQYEKIYASSWKEPEPFAGFNAAFMRVCAAEGSLRLGILELNAQPIAAQFWVRREKWAGVLKLAHDEAFRALSPGTVLTALMIRRLLDEEGVSELDFGRGDDDYKKDWTGERRQRIGVVLANPLRFSGVTAIARHFAGSARRRYIADANKASQGGVPKSTPP